MDIPVLRIFFFLIIFLKSTCSQEKPEDWDEKLNSIGSRTQLQVLHGIPQLTMNPTQRIFSGEDMTKLKLLSNYQEKTSSRVFQKLGRSHRSINSSTNDYNTERIRLMNENELMSQSNWSNANENVSFANPPKPPIPPIHQYFSRFPITEVSNYENFKSDYESWARDNKSDGKVCRHYGYLPKRLFALNSCAHCYNYVRNTPGLFGNPSRKWNMTETEWRVNGKMFILSVLTSDTQNMTVFANVSDPESALLSSFANEDARRKWVDCCHAAEKCCERIQTTFPLPTLESGGERSCSPTWDGWQCWNETKSETSVYEPCPHYIYFTMTEVPSCTVYAEKSCGKNGEWKGRVNSRTGQSKEWTNYASCGSAVIDALKRRTYVHVMAYGFSIIAIIPALIVFFAYKQLRVDRIILHRNLFASMMVNGLVVIAFKTLVILNELQSESSPNSIINQNGVGCRLLFILTKYSRLTNYMWMFCEGYYLHKLIAAAFAEQKSLLIFYLIGWAFPVIPTLIYAIIRMSSDELNDRCWVVPVESIEWIFNGPSLLSLLVNMLFLINIIRVLVTKLRAAHANEPSQYRKAVRATLVLLPLFGLHFVVTIYRPASGTCKWMETYYHINDVLDGLQGLLVALIFCYLNGEVLNLLKRTYGRWREQNLAGCTRNSSNARLRSRQSRGGSMLGRSVVSTQCYSSVPASPETCNATTRLTIITPALPSGGGMLENNPLGGDIGKKSNGINRNSLTTTTSPNHLNSIVKINNDNTWTEVQLNDLSDITSNFEMKPQKNLNPTTVTNGIKVEHQL